MKFITFIFIILNLFSSFKEDYIEYYNLKPLNDFSNIYDYLNKLENSKNFLEYDELLILTLSKINNFNKNNLIFLKKIFKTYEGFNLFLIQYYKIYKENFNMSEYKFFLSQINQIQLSEIINFDFFIYHLKSNSNLTVFIWNMFKLPIYKIRIYLWFSEDFNFFLKFQDILYLISIYEDLEQRYLYLNNNKKKFNQYFKKMILKN